MIIGQAGIASTTVVPQSPLPVVEVGIHLLMPSRRSGRARRRRCHLIPRRDCKKRRAQWHSSNEQVKKLFDEASSQVSRYADSDIVRDSVKTTTLHKLVVIYRGIDMVTCEEIQ